MKNVQKNNQKNIKEHIIDYCNVNDIPRTQFAKKSGVSLNTINELLYGRTYMCGDKVLKELCEFMGINTYDVIPNYDAIRYTNAHVREWLKIRQYHSDVKLFENPDFATAFTGVCIKSNRAIYNYDEMIDFLVSYQNLSMDEAIKTIAVIHKHENSSPIIIQGVKGDTEWYAIKRKTSLQNKD